MRNDQVTVLNDKLENHREDSLEEEGTEDRRKTDVGPFRSTLAIA